MITKNDIQLDTCKFIVNTNTLISKSTFQFQDHSLILYDHVSYMAYDTDYVMLCLFFCVVE